MAKIVTYSLKQGRWTMPKDPDDIDWYGLELVDFLPDGVTIVSDPEQPKAIVAGVTLLEGPRIQGTQIVARLGSLDTDPDAEPADNFCTFRFYLSNGARRDYTLYFTRKDN